VQPANVELEAFSLRGGPRHATNRLDLRSARARRSHPVLLGERGLNDDRVPEEDSAVELQRVQEPLFVRHLNVADAQALP